MCENLLIIKLLPRSQNGQASHWLSLSRLPHCSTSNSPQDSELTLKCSFA